MKINILKKLLYLSPVIVLLVTLFFLNYAVQYFKDSNYDFVYNTNKESVERFSRELNNLSAQGYTSDVYGDLYTRIIKNYGKTMGEKEAIVTFIIDETGQIVHSTAHNQLFLLPLLQNENNMALVNDAYASRANGEITLETGERPLTMFYHWFYSGPKNYSLFMCVERQAVEEQTDVLGIVIPISIVGLLVMFTLQVGISHLAQDFIRDNREKQRRDEE
jgi:hypothetical protein